MTEIPVCIINSIVANVHFKFRDSQKRNFYVKMGNIHSYNVMKRTLGRVWGLRSIVPVGDPRVTCDAKEDFV